MLKVFCTVTQTQPLVTMCIIRCITKHRLDRSSSRRSRNLTVKYGNTNLQRFTGEYGRHLCAFLCGEIERKLLHLKFVGRLYATLNMSSCLLSVY